ncbi:putative endo-1,4-beta-xylanase [Helianthus annuus]|uniref:Endo-1,4-beta-xylanase n=1 Tax=Helianthus annuus TaxID=4232 RepID=A0A251V6L4_HELAN|nr:putative endo-1,4-beta-xylanase [Helianthus annuus]KAJ0592830.1 putative endo-1,4-beta-xylanase [Helianthus annuus]KAJ0600496.1 putative endo-1,4-beta-xylanase [Helianthus annuus]KAJ0607831.1 putative endo-1,4-beta-xylanase [Helianthus annuus]KAJ0767895.1 putative endo-1,4-beta-xylanase [Helianthus annuus]
MNSLLLVKGIDHLIVSPKSFSWTRINSTHFLVWSWLQISNGDAAVVATFKTPTGYHDAGSTRAKSGCWSMLKGGLTVNKSGPAHLYFQSENPLVDIWVDSVSLQPFTPEEWKSHQYQSIEKVRRSKVKIQAVDGEGKPQGNRTLIIAQKFARFPFGCAINKNILTNQAYKNWFISRFKYTTFENEMKWYSNEARQNREDYNTSDALLQFTKSNGISVRGHNVFWDDPKYQPYWVHNLGPKRLAAAATTRIRSVMRRYSGQVIAWDVLNENLHFNFFERKLGWTAASKFYATARALDRTAGLFLNDFNTIESPGDQASSPDSYLSKIRQIRAGGYHGPLSIGLEGHFRYANIPYMRSAIDKVASSGLPIWITEVDVQAGPNQAAVLDQVLREAHAHPSVHGIVLWSAWSPQGCYRMCLTDNNFNNLPTGNVVDTIIRQFFNVEVTATTDVNGFYETSLIHGDYEVSFADQYQSEKDMNLTQMAQHFVVEASEDTLHVKVLA